VVCLFGRFDFLEAGKMFESASKSRRDLAQFAIVLRDLSSMSDCENMHATDFSRTANILAFLRVRLMIPFH
jgi:hypothetical protein